MPTLGCIPSPPDVRDYKLVVAGSVGPLPESFELIPPKVKNQGGTSSCVAHAASSAVEYFHAQEHEAVAQFSTEFIYGYRPKDYYQGNGMIIREALQTLAQLGDVFWINLPGNHQVEEARANVDKHLEALTPLAAPHKIAEYYRCRGAEEMKRALVTGHPLICCIAVRQGDHLDSTHVWRTDPKANITGYHALMIYGYNTVGFLTQNSWGTVWGNGGRFILPYDFELGEVWGLRDQADPDAENDIKRPFRSFIGQIIAKVINFFLRLGRK